MEINPNGFSANPAAPAGSPSDDAAASAQSAPAVVALVRDLMFSSKISATAKASAAAVKMVRDPAQLSGVPGQLLLADLNLPGAIEAAGKWLRELAGRQAIGFVSHVDTQAIAAARAVGVTAWPRSRFVVELPAVLAGITRAELPARSTNDEKR